LAVLNLYYEQKFVWGHSTLITPLPTARNQSLLQSRSFLILKSSQSAELAVVRVDMSGETIRLSISLTVAAEIFFTFNVHKRQTNAGT